MPTGHAGTLLEGAGGSQPDSPWPAALDTVETWAGERGGDLGEWT